MSSLSKNKTTKIYRLGYTYQNKREQIVLGKVSKTVAVQFQLHFDQLLQAKQMSATIPPIIIQWLDNLDDKYHSKLVRKGFATARVQATLSDFTSDYIEGHDAKKSTKQVMRRAQRYLLDFYGDIDIRVITRDSVEKWETATIQGGGGRSKNTIRRAAGYARQFMNAAVKQGIITENPFHAISAQVTPNRDRMHYITREATYAMIEAAPTDEWKALIAVLRFAGPRSPSELIPMRWEDVNWGKIKPSMKRLRVDTDDVATLKIKNVKTANHKTEYRVFPLFESFAVFLRKIKQDTGPIFPMLHEVDAESVPRRLRYFMLKSILPVAGLAQWPRLFQAFRASCATDFITDGESIDIAAVYMGHSPEELRKSYYMQTGEQIENSLNNERKVV